MHFARLATALLPMLSAPSQAQPNTLQGFKMVQPPKIDGTIDPAEWAGVPSADHFSDRVTGQQEPQETRFWLAYDEHYLYFAARMDDPAPNGLHAEQYKTDASLEGDDYIRLDIDPFGATSAYNQFAINPRGATSLSIAGGRAVKREWLGEFLAAARVTSTGWEAEARIPWGIMRLPSPGVRELSINVLRNDPRSSRSFYWRYSPANQDNYGKWTGVDLPKSGNQRNLLLLPYGYIGADENTGRIVNGGLDMKTSITDRIDMVGSINPDFRNVENSILSLDFSYFRRLAHETRPFFLEGDGFFSTSLDAPLYVSQAIPQFDFGAKTFGRLNDKMQVAVMVTNTVGKQNDVVTNFRYLTDPTLTWVGSYVGHKEQGISNDGTFLSVTKTFGPLGIFAQHESTQDTQVGYGHRINTGAFYMRNGLSVQSEYLEISQNFFPRIGFAPEVDTRGAFVSADWDRRSAKGAVAETEFFVRADEYHHFNGKEFHGQRLVDGDIALRNNMDINFGAQAETFEGSHDYAYNAEFTYPRGNPHSQIQASYIWGRISSIQYENASLSAAWMPARTLQLTLSLQGVRHGPSQAQTIFGMNWDLGRDMSLGGRVVKSGHDTNAYLALKRAGNRGIEYYFIFGDPNSVQFQRSLVLKVVVPFSLKLR